MIERFYAQATEVDGLFLSRHTTAWQIFDREYLTPQGECQAIAMAVSRYQAYKIKEALNKVFP
jgi:hypothetical protein